MNILIAEDQYIIRMMLELSMEEWGFNFDMACNGLEAVRCARMNQGRYDLCIMDISMPVMDGIEATLAIRREVGYFPILGYSTDISLREQCLAAGMDGFLLKPCSKEVLHAAIEEVGAGGSG